ATSEAGALFADWRPSGTSGETWQLSFASDQAGQPFRINLTPRGALPAGFEIVAFEGEREIDLASARAITGVVGSSAPRTFTVGVGSADFVTHLRAEVSARVSTFALAAPFPNPTNLGSTIDLAVPSPVTAASVQLYDVVGRLVATLFQ